MDENTDTLDEALLATCHIRSDRGQASGVFIGDNRVLTAWHVVEDAIRLTFTNSHRQSGHVAKSSKIFRDVDSDLAILTLDKPLGIHHAEVVSTERAKNLGTKGWLVSRFRDAPIRSPAMFNVLLPFDEYSTIFNVAADCLGPGFSGSPILDRTGQVISVVARGGDMDGRGNNQSGINSLLHEWTLEKTGVPFIGALPSRLASLVENARKLG